MSRMLRAALRYAELGEQLGFRVFPLGELSKTPNGALVRKGHLQATTDAEVIRYWWQRSPNGNIGLRLMDVWALDIDPRNGGDARLEQWVARYGVLPDTAVQLTGSGGLHYIFACVPDFEGIKWGRLTNGVDIKGGSRGYIVGAPSVHPETGTEYEWRPGYEIGRHPVAIPPDWLVKIVLTRKRERKVEGVPHNTISVPRCERVRLAREYADEQPISQSGSGGHDNAIRVVGAVVRGFDLTEMEAFEALATWNRNCRPPWSERELRHKIQSALKYSKARGYLLRKAMEERAA